MLGSGLPGHNVFDVARSLLERFGSLRAMLDATPDDFDGVRGVGPSQARANARDHGNRAARACREDA